MLREKNKTTKYDMYVLSLKAPYYTNLQIIFFLVSLTGGACSHDKQSKKL